MPYGALSYQIPTSSNCRPFGTQLCALLLASHETQTFNVYMTKLVSFQWASITNFMLLTTDSNTNTPFT